MSVRYLGPKKRDKVVALYQFDLETEKIDFWKLLQALNVIIRVINSWREEVDLEKFGPFVTKTHVKMHEMFPEIWDNGIYLIDSTVVCIKVGTASFPRFWKNHP